jgi:dihydroxyacetone kinase-like protein
MAAPNNNRPSPRSLSPCGGEGALQNGTTRSARTRPGFATAPPRPACGERERGEGPLVVSQYQIRIPHPMTALSLDTLITEAAAAIAAHAEELTALDQAIGDGDHGVNMKRGFEALEKARAEIAALPFGQGLQKAGMALVMSVGGASGPLYGSLLMAMGKAAAEAPADRAALAAMVAAGVEAVKKRGKSEAGEKTMLDVLVPVAAALAEGGDPRAAADAGLEATREMRATKGRASFLGERSIGHLDPGARSSALLVHVVCDHLEGSS